ncbi:MAG: ATP-binding cassette domain-containing protein [Acidimicrobiales bacterium]
MVERGIGYVPQNNNVFPSLTIRENLEMGNFLRPTTNAERVDYVVSLFPHLKDRIDQRAGSLSGGERQMLAMGRALMMDPAVLLLDEPSAGLSPALQDQVFIRTKQINATGVTIIMVEQNASRLLADLRSRVCARPGHQRLQRHGSGIVEGPQGDRALPRHAHQVPPIADHKKAAASTPFRA